MTMTLANGLVLYEFQERACRKLASQKSRLNGDDMGLGKTLQALVLDRLNRMQHKSTPKKKTLIVTKLGVIADNTWQRHIKMVAPDAKVFAYDATKQPSLARKEFVAKLKEDFDYYIIHWDGVRLATQLTNVWWFHIVADEVHKIKNRKSAVRKQFIRIRATYKTGCSGTPAADKPHDLWAILNWLWPQYYRSYHNFVRHYCLFEDKENPKTGARFRVFEGVQNVHELQKEMEPWFVRRLKVDVMEDLPDKTYTPAWVDLLPKQRQSYNEMSRTMMTWLENSGEEVHMNTTTVVGKLQRLQQFALAYMKPNSKYAEWSLQYGAKYEAWKEFCRKLAQQGVPKEKYPKCPVPKPPSEFLMSEPSSKLDWAMSYLEDNDHPVVFFSQFSSILTLFQKRLQAAGVSHGLFTGAMSYAHKKETVRSFQDGKLQVFAGTIGAGGEGIELTRSSRMVFLDRAWTPGVNTQAEDREWRIGQPNAVEIIDCMARNTVDLGRKARVLEKRIWIATMLGDPIKLQPSDKELLEWQERQRRVS